MSSLSVFLSAPPEVAAGSSPQWNTLHVPPSKHDIKPFLAFLRAELKVSEEYGFKLSISQKSCDQSAGETPLSDPKLKPITSVSEFQELFETLEWQDGSGIILVVELKKKDPAQIAAAAATPKFQAPSKATATPYVVPAYVPVQSHNTTVPVGSTTSNGSVVGERDASYKNPVTASSSSTTTTPSWASQNRFNQSAEQPKPDPALRSVSDKFALFGGATSVVRNKVEDRQNGVTSSASSTASWIKPTPAVPPSAPEPVIQVSTATVTVPPVASGSVRATPIATAPVQAAQHFVPTPVTAQRFSLGDPDLDLPPPPSDFSDPFAHIKQPPLPTPPGASVHPPLPTPPGAALTHPPLPSPPQPQLQVAKVFTVGGADDALPPPPPSSSSSAVGTIQQASSLAPLSSFLAQLKPSHAQLSFLYACDDFNGMIQLCKTQIGLYETEVATGVLQSNTTEKQQAANGVLIYFFHFSLGYNHLQAYKDAIEIARKFQEQYEALPPILQQEPVNQNMFIQLLHNTGLALERQGDASGAIQALEAAANLLERVSALGADASSAGSTSLTPTILSVKPALDCRSDIYSALGNLYTSLKKFPEAVEWHTKAITVEDSKTASGTTAKKWTIYHAAASCHAQRGEFQRAIELDSIAEQLIVASGAKPNPRIYFNRGLCYQKLQPPNFPASVDDFSKVIEADSKAFPKAYTLRAKGLLRAQDWSGVIADCSTVLKLTPTDNQAREFLAFAQQQQQQQQQ